jgi:hypothetical protein
MVRAGLHEASRSSTVRSSKRRRYEASYWLGGVRRLTEPGQHHAYWWRSDVSERRRGAAKTTNTDQGGVLRAAEPSGRHLVEQLRRGSGRAEGAVHHGCIDVQAHPFERRVGRWLAVVADGGLIRGASGRRVSVRGVDPRRMPELGRLIGQ